MTDFSPLRTISGDLDEKEKEKEKEKRVTMLSTVTLAASLPRHGPETRLLHFRFGPDFRCRVRPECSLYSLPSNPFLKGLTTRNELISFAACLPCRYALSKGFNFRVA